MTVSAAVSAMFETVFPMLSKMPRFWRSPFGMLALPKSRSYVPAISDHGFFSAVRWVVSVAASSRTSVILQCLISVEAW